MYENYFNLAALPFSNTPDSRFFFETEQHREALARLEYTVRNRRGFALITGEIGSGKTMLTRTLLRRLGNSVRAAIVNNTRVNSEQLLRVICAELKIEIPDDADKAMILTKIRRFAEANNVQDRTVVIIIDEGQCLGIDEFEEVRLLTNLENETEKLVQLLILGQPELKPKLMHPRLAPLIQRIVMYTHLKPMSFEDMTRYVAFRLVRASKGRPNVDFSRTALQAIFERSGGVPRVINLVCDNALLTGFANDTRFIDSRIVQRAISQMLPDFDGPPPDFLTDEDLQQPALNEETVSDGRRLQGNESFEDGGRVG